MTETTTVIIPIDSAKCSARLALNLATAEFWRAWYPEMVVEDALTHTVLEPLGFIAGTLSVSIWRNQADKDAWELVECGDSEVPPLVEIFAGDEGLTILHTDAHSIVQGIVAKLPVLDAHY